ncbi:MAG: ATP-dependent 6-phosphofructokinase [Candidatus Aenigmatarchaeota archaeon]
MKIGVMTGGGDCPGLNAVIQAVVKRAADYKCEVIGFLDGYDGLINGRTMPLDMKNVRDIYQDGGTLLGTSRKNPFKSEEETKKAMDNLKKLNIDAMVIIGGDDTLGAAKKLNDLGVNVVGVPKTIDNDLSSTDYCIGFQTAVATAAEEIARLQTTAKSHDRVLIAEIMGRHAGWLTLMAGLAGGAHIILVPEKDFDIKSVCRTIMKREKKGETYTVIAVAEGAKPKSIGDLVTVSKEKDEFGHERLGGIAETLAKEIEKRTGKSTRSVVLGHVQRGGSPVAFDINFGIRLGIAAVDLVKKGKFGYAVVLKGIKIAPVKLEKVVEKNRTLSKDLLKLTDFFSMM